MEFNVLLKSFQIDYCGVYEGSMKIEGIISPKKPCSYFGNQSDVKQLLHKFFISNPL